MNDSSLRKLYPVFTMLGLLVSGLFIVAYYRDQFREWKEWQKKYIQKEKARAASAEQRAEAARVPVEIKQIVLPDLNRADRCMTCHVAVEDPSYAGFTQPLSYHPNHDRHPFEKFGCTICHQGQSRATTRDAAHGQVKHWKSPMLPMKYIESACAKCHIPDDIPDAANLTRGYNLFLDMGCIGCHKLEGRGGVIGPELDKVGATRSPEWLKKHFRNPAAVSVGSGMPPVQASENEIEALTIYMLGLTGEKLSAYYVSTKTIPGPHVGHRLFQEKGCIGCHSVGGTGGNVGPPLDEVAKRRTPEWIIEHFRNPQAVTPGTVMPRFDLTEPEIRALTEFLLSLSDPTVVGFIKPPPLVSPTERGKAVYKKYGCNGCHGKDGEGGIPNPNAKTAQQVPGLKYVGEGYNKQELRERILNGQREIIAMDKTKPPPPLYMPPWHGKIAEGELEDLIAYLFSLMPEEDVGF